MRKPNLPEPTEAELAIRDVLWDQGPTTVRAVHGERIDKRKTGFTTILKLLQLMHEKGLVRRDERSRSHVYQPRMGREQTQRPLVGDLRQRAFGGSARELVGQALVVGQVSKAELAEIGRLLKGRSNEKG
ncbi:MAG: BlaI/MecI/CopY family transcriptional regulator [Candidatus Handelsmanbacteria bacterium]|nr:BlaI/MecI/CopY family transcriptional regulator [Candidatus Handelsmanbacteria bacterium]